MTEATRLYLGRPASPVAALRLPFFFLFFLFFFGFICSGSSGGSFSSLSARNLTQTKHAEVHKQIIVMVVEEAVVDVVTHEVRPSGPTTLAQPQITIDDLP